MVKTKINSSDFKDFTMNILNVLFIITTLFLLRVLHGYKFLHPKLNRLFFFKPGSEPNRHSYTRTRTRTRPEYLYPDPTDTFKNLINFSNFYFIKNIKNIQRNSIFSSTPMGDESLNHHQIHFDSIFSILIIVKN
jgi:hypothetical protein